MPEAGENPWRRWIDTALDSPHDILPWETAESVTGHVYRVEAHSVVMLFAEFDLVIHRLRRLHGFIRTPV